MTNTTDPVDTGALRGVSARLAAVPISGTMEQRMTVMRAQVELTRAADEVDRLRALIENEPHAVACNYEMTWRDGSTLPCACWKADAP